MHPVCQICVAVIFAAGLLGQRSPPERGVQGHLVEWDGSATAGELSIRVKDHHVYLFRFDVDTRFLRDDRQIFASDVRQGDLLEVVSDLGPGKPRSRARVVYLLQQVPAYPQRVTRRKPNPYRTRIDELFPRGSLTFAGVVIRLSENMMALRTRSEGEKTLLLRSDTRYLEDGSEVDRAALKVNMRVFVRAGISLDGEPEVYQVIWGEILFPK